MLLLKLALHLGESIQRDAQKDKINIPPQSEYASQY